MKKILSVFLICGALISAHAVDPEFQGNFLSALEENNPTERARKIVYALEKSSCCDRDALEALAMTINENGPRHDLFIRIIALWEKFPDNPHAAKFCINYAFNNKDYPERYINALEMSIKAVDFNKLSGEGELLSAFQKIDHFNTVLVERKNPDRAAILLDELRKKFPVQDIILHVSADNAVAGLFLKHALLTNMPQFQQLPDSDPWKIRIRQIGEELLKLKVSDRYDAGSVVENAIKLHLPEAPELLKKYVAAYPDHYWSAISASAAAKYRKHSLFVPVKGNDSANFFCYLHVRNFPVARRTIKKLPANRKDWLIIFNSARGKHQQIVSDIIAEPDMLKELLPITLSFMANSIHMSKKHKALEIFMQTLKSNVQLLKQPVLCNSAAYIAADFNIMLDDAIRLSAFAVKTAPTESAYLDTFAWILYRKGKFAEAERIIDEAIKFIPFQRSSCVIYLHAARIKIAVKKNAEAKILLEKAKTLYSPEIDECSEYDPALQQETEKLLK